MTDWKKERKKERKRERKKEKKEEKLDSTRKTLLNKCWEQETTKIILKKKERKVNINLPNVMQILLSKRMETFNRRNSLPGAYKYIKTSFENKLVFCFNYVVK